MKRKKRTVASPELPSKTPKSFVIRLGKVTKNVKQLEEDLRVTMMPFTAKNLKEQKFNTLRDFVGAASMLKVSHLLVLNQKGSTIRFDLMRDVRRAWESSRNIALPRRCQKPPLLLLNGFSNPPKAAAERVEHIKAALGSMFPTIEVENVHFKSLNTRVLLVDYCVEQDTINFRHYVIRYQLTGGSHNKRIMRLYSLMQSLAKEEPEAKKEPIDENELMETDSASRSLAGLAKAMKKVKVEPADHDENKVTLEMTDSGGSKDNVVIDIPYRNFVHHDAENAITSNVKVPVKFSLVEVGPRLTLKLDKVYEKAFGGAEINLEEELEGFYKESDTDDDTKDVTDKSEDD